MTLLYQPNMLITKFIFKGFARGSVLKNLPAMQAIWVQSLGQGTSPGERNGNPL